MHGFLGPNGAGKSTTIRVLLGLLRRDAGEATVLGGDPWDDAVELHARLTYEPGDVHLWPNPMVASFEAVPILALAGVAIVLTALAFAAHRHRDLVTAA